MKPFFKRFFIPAILVFALGTVLGLTVDEIFSNDDTVEQLQKLEDAYILINRQYVEDVDPAAMTQEAILAMLKKLDPHSSYIDAESMKKVGEEYQGVFGGIGIWFESPAGDTSKVTSTIPDGPSETAGLLPRDRLVAVNDSSIVGFGSLDIQDLIKGAIGTKVKITVVRPRVKAPIDFMLTRATIPLYSIDAGYMLDSVTGYVRIGRFAMTTHQEFIDHVSRLKKEGMKRLILDLRGNPGGIKQTAVQIADEMLDVAGVIVSTKGRVARENEVDQVTKGGLLIDEPVIILVDESSASGSEIVAGALQDHDRALIVGRRTFGKGLVQRPFQMRDGSVIQMTVARYYMPSGRLIQTPYDIGHFEDYYKDKFAAFEEATYNPAKYLSEIPDSLHYKTLHGRDVFGGGGVMPDAVMAPDSTSALVSPLVQFTLVRGLAFLYASHLLDTEGLEFRAKWASNKDQFFTSFKVDDAVWNQFVDHSKKNGLEIGGVSTEEKPTFSQKELDEHRGTLSVILKARIAQRLYRSEAWYPVFNSIDPLIISAQTLWKDAEKLAKLAKTPAIN
ncbi:MAG: S41 family peptidase [Bacteroidetes bacterium]|nr:S41 family peptidase [Bacteroidota bacterium]